MDTPLIEAHRAAGARMGDFAGSTLPDAFAELERECGAARESVAIFDANWHAFLELTGRDRVKYLHAISSNNIQALETGQGTPGAAAESAGAHTGRARSVRSAGKAARPDACVRAGTNRGVAQEIRDRIAGENRRPDRPNGKFFSRRSARSGDYRAGLRRKARRYG